MHAGVHISHYASAPCPRSKPVCVIGVSGHAIAQQRQPGFYDVNNGGRAPFSKVTLSTGHRFTNSTAIYLPPAAKIG